jgi:phage terminase large subunit GpA-like protein
MSYLPPPFTLLPGEIQVLESRPRVSTAEWAEKNFRIVAGPYAGQYFQHNLAPYAKGIMDMWDRPCVRKIFIVAPSQTTKTSIGYACVAADIWRDPASAGIGMPDEKAAARIFEEKLGKHYLKSPMLRKDLIPDKQAIQKTKLLLKGATIYGLWSGSESSMSSVSLRVLMIDEEDANMDKSSVSTMEERTISYQHDSKIIRVSKPRGTEDEGTIWKDMKNQSQAIYQFKAVCPACRTAQIMIKDRIRVPEGIRDAKEILHKKLAWYECECCGYQWNDHIRNLAVAGGHWWTETPVSNPETVGFHLPSWVSRYVSLSKVAHDWFLAHQAGTPGQLTRFDNNHKAMPGKVVSVQTDEDRVRDMVRPDCPPMIVPSEAVALTMGIDVQMLGFYYVVRAWAKSGESWLVEYGWLDSWGDIERVVFETTWPVDGMDEQMGIWRAGVDLGGAAEGQDKTQGWSQSEETKRWLLSLDDLGVDLDRVYAVKGASRPQDQVVRPSKVGLEPGVPAKFQTPIMIRLLDTVELKDQIAMVRLKKESRQPMWLHRDVAEDYIKQITSEKRIPGKGKNGRALWDAGGRANHLLDCEVYAAACAHADWAPRLQQLPGPQYALPENSVPTSGAHAGNGLSGMRINPWAR